MRPIKPFKISLIGLFIAIANLSVSAETTHVVDRGETLESIAKKYGVTSAQIIELNPTAAQFIYVGMELNIPEKIVQPVYQQSSTILPEGTTTQYSASPQQFQNAQSVSAAATYENRVGKWTPTMSFGINLIPKPKDYDNNRCSKYLGVGMIISLGANYFFTDVCYFSTRVGYRWASQSWIVEDYGESVMDTEFSRGKLTDGSYDNDYYVAKTSVDGTFHMIDAIIELGVLHRIHDSKWGIGFFANVEPGIGIAGKINYKNGGYEKSRGNFGGEFVAGAAVGITLCYKDIKIRPAVNFAINDNYKSVTNDKASFQISFGF